MNKKKILKYAALGYGAAVLVAIWRSGAQWTLTEIQARVFDPAGTVSMAISGPAVDIGGASLAGTSGLPVANGVMAAPV